MAVKKFLKGLAGSRPRIIAVIGTTRGEILAGVEHARTAPGQFPVWAWCAAPIEPPAGCDRFTAGVGPSAIARDLLSVWPALTIVAWTGGRGGSWMKLLPLFVPPFRVLAFNEANGFFAARPGAVLRHAQRRLADGCVSGARRLRDWARGCGPWSRSIRHRAGEKLRDAGMLAWSVALAMMGSAARLTPALSRFAMRRLGSECRPEITPVWTTHCGFSEVVVPGRAWPRRKVLRALKDSQDEFIVFRRPDAPDRADALVSAAHATGAFAVAAQIAYTGWRLQAINKHPFRPLQPGETARVFAPWSDAIAMRRDWLLRFGVPHAATYGAALSMLYWKAAAEGFTCVAVGCVAPLTQEPAMELEDAEFAARVGLSGALRWAGPSHEDRPRGNVASSPAHTRGFRGKPRILVVSPYLPFPLSHGGAVRIYNLCRALSGDFDFVLACFREANETVRYPELHEVFCQVHVVDTDEKHADTTIPDQVAGYRNSAMAALIRRLRAELAIDIVQLEYTQMAEYRSQAGDLPVLLVEHDITFMLHRQLAEASRKPEAHRQYGLWKDFERQALASTTAVWTMSDQDRGLAIECGAAPEDVTVVPNGVDLHRFQPAARQTVEPAVLFVGSFRHLPNLLAFEALRNEIMPAVWRQCSDARLRVIAGPGHDRAAEAAGRSALLLGDPRIHIDGFVEDVRPAYAECDVVVIPLPVSAGTNIKVMEAMACGRAIVSTPVGCQGLDLADGADLMVSELGYGFSVAVAGLLLDPALRERIAARARRTAEARFGWDAIARQAAVPSYRALLRPAYSLSER